MDVYRGDWLRTVLGLGELLHSKANGCISEPARGSTLGLRWIASYAQNLPDSRKANSGAVAGNLRRASAACPLRYELVGEATGLSGKSTSCVTVCRKLRVLRDDAPRKL